MRDLGPLPFCLAPSAGSHGRRGQTPLRNRTKAYGPNCFCKHPCSSIGSIIFCVCQFCTVRIAAPHCFSASTVSSSQQSPLRSVNTCHSCPGHWALSDQARNLDQPLPTFMYLPFLSANFTARVLHSFRPGRGPEKQVQTSLGLLQKLHVIICFLIVPHFVLIFPNVRSLF